MQPTRELAEVEAMVRVLVAALCAGAAILILLILSGSNTREISEKTIILTLAFAFLSLTATAGTNLAQRQPELATIGYLTVAISITAFLLAVGVVCSAPQKPEPVIYALLAAFAAANTSILLFAGHTAHQPLLNLVRIGTLTALWSLIVLAIIDIANSSVAPIGMKPIAVIGVLYAVGAVVTLLLATARRERP